MLGAVGVLTGTEAGDVGDDVTATEICLPPPLPGAWAMHPARGRTIDARSRRENRETRLFRKEPSDRQEAIRNGWGEETGSVFRVPHVVTLAAGCQT